MRKTRQELEHPKPYVTPHGIYQLNPQTGTYEFQAIPQTLKDPANVARLKYILNLLQSDNPGEQELGRAELARDRAPADAVTTRAQTDATRLKQSFQTHVERLKAKEVEVDKRLANATLLGNQAQTQHLNHEPPTAWNTLSNNEL